MVRHFELEVAEFEPGNAVVRGIGVDPGGPLEDSQLVAMMRRRVPITEVAKAAVRDIRAVAGLQPYEGVVGEQCSTLLIGPDAGMRVSSGYHVRGVADVYHIPSYVQAGYAEQGAWLITNHTWRSEADDGRTAVLATEVVKGKHPCPCGGGRRYKHCHGSRRNKTQLEDIRSTFYLEIVQLGTEEITLASIRSLDGVTPDGLGIGPVDGLR